MAIASCYQPGAFCGRARYVPPWHAAHRRRYGSSSIPDSAPLACAAACGPLSLGRSRQHSPQSCSDRASGTAFTIGHSATLALGAWGLVSLPGRVVEVLIAFSILVSAFHALRPLFPGREPAIAAGFGLVHGLAFATTLQNLGVGPWQRIASILGFNLGIETMQLIVVAAVLPSLVILSRTPAYTFFRFWGALAAGFTSLGWMIERFIGVPDFVDGLVDRIAQRGVWIAISLLVISIVLWLRPALLHSDQNVIHE